MRSKKAPGCWSRGFRSYEIQCQYRDPHHVCEEVTDLREAVASEEADLMTKKEVACALNVSVRTVDSIIAEGELPSMKIRRCRRIPREAFYAFLRRQVSSA